MFSKIYGKFLYPPATFRCNVVGFTLLINLPAVCDIEHMRR